METATQVLHRLTSMAAFDEATEGDPPVGDPRVLPGLKVRDLDRLPLFYKSYPASLPRIALPRDLPATTAPAVDVLAGTARVAAAELDLAQLARLLHLSAGVVRTMRRPYGTYLFRAAGSAGGRFPLEVYAAAPGGGPIPAGTFWYHPEEHSLVLVGPPPEGRATTLVVTGVPWRTGWAYRERGFRHVYWDAGTMLSQLLAAADSAGVPARLYTRFPDRAVAALVGADRVHEWPVAVVALGTDAPAQTSAHEPPPHQPPPRQPPRHEPPPHEPPPHEPSPHRPLPHEPLRQAAAAGFVDTAPVEFPLVTAAQRAGERDTYGPAWDRGDPVGVSPYGGPPVEAVALARGSQRLMDPSRGLPRQLLETSLGVALRGVGVPHWVVVHDVAGLSPGVYRWPGLSAPVRAGRLREQLYRVCCDQGLGRDAAFVVIAATDVGALDDRQYREAQLAAGLVEGRLHLLAYALGASASGMTFADGLLPALLGEPWDGLLCTCVGVPEYRSTAGGPPGAPRPVRLIKSRL